jgi:PAS domain S-box-containing protein
MDLESDNGMCLKEERVNRREPETKEMERTSVENERCRQFDFQYPIEESQSSLDAIFDSVQSGIIIIDAVRHTILDINPAAAKMFGADKDAILGSVCHRFICPAEFGKCPITDLGLTIDNTERTLVKSDGEMLPILKTVVPIIVAGRRCLLETCTDISVRKQAEEALRRSEDKYRKIFENIQDVFYRADNDGNITDISPSIERYSGYRCEELIGKPISMVYFDPEDRKRLLSSIAENGEVIDYVIRLRSKDHRILYASVNAHLFRDPEGMPIGVEGTLRDISDRILAENILQRERETFLTILENDPSGVALIDSDGVCLYLNPEFTAITGYTLDDVPTEDDWFRQAYPDQEYRGAVAKAWARERALEAKSHDAAYRIHCKDGQIKEIEFRHTFLSDCAITVLNDVTGRKQAEQALRESEEKYRNLFENAVGGIFQCTPDGRVINANLALSRMLGYESPRALIAAYGNRPGEMCADPFRFEEFKRILWERGFVRNFEVCLYRKDGDIVWASINARPAPLIQKGKAPHYEGTVEDITSRRQAEEAKLNSEKLQSALEMAGTICHEMNQPIQIVSGYVDLLSMNKSDDEETQKKLERIKAQIQRMGIITRKLMALNEYRASDYVGIGKILDISVCQNRHQSQCREG